MEGCSPKSGGPTERKQAGHELPIKAPASSCQGSPLEPNSLIGERVRICGFLGEPGGVLASAELVAVIERVTACRDPKDDKFL
jgi:hypothetical protein